MPVCGGDQGEVHEGVIGLDCVHRRVAAVHGEIVGTVEDLAEGLQADVLIPCGHHLVDQGSRDRLPGLVMAGEAPQDLGLPHPVLHDLRRRLNEVAFGLCSRESGCRHLGEQVVEDVTELVKQRVCFVVLQQRR